MGSAGEGYMVYKAMLSAIAVLSSTTAMAQVAPPLAAAPSGDQPVAQQAGGLEDIVVTARRRSESSQNIPVAVTAFSAEQIRSEERRVGNECVSPCSYRWG